MTHDDFLKAIAHQPEESLPKLVYGDWLEEQGDPTADAIRWLADCTLLEFRAWRPPGVPSGAPFWHGGSSKQMYLVSVPIPDRPNWRVSFRSVDYREAIRAYPHILSEEARVKQEYWHIDGFYFMNGADFEYYE